MKSNNLNPKTDPGELPVYQIRLKGHLDRQWTDWFGGLTITLEENGDTLLTGPVAYPLRCAPGGYARSRLC